MSWQTACSLRPPQEEHMRFPKMLFAAILTVALAGTAFGQEQPSHPFGLGLMVGAPTGLSAKYYLGRRGMAIAAGLGEVQKVGPDDGISLHVDLLWHPVILTRQNAFTLPLYVGVGGRYLHDGDNWDCWFDGNGRRVCGYDYDDDDYLGVRVPVGILMDFYRVPLDVFFEIAMVVAFHHFDDGDNFDDDHDRVSLNGSLGVRYYF